VLLSPRHYLLSLNTVHEALFYESLQPFYHDYEDTPMNATLARTHPAFANEHEVVCRDCAIRAHSTIGVERVEMGLSSKYVPVTADALEIFHHMTGSQFRCTTCDKGLS